MDKNNRKDSGFILFSNPEVLEESVEEPTLKYQEKEVKRLVGYINRQLNKKKPQIVAYLAPYGSGKSVVLNNALKELSEEYKKVQFDIWQCSDKKDTWESFLIKMISKLNGKKEKYVISKIDGTKIKWLKLFLFFMCYICLSFIAWSILKESNFDIIRFLRAFLIYAAPVFLVLAGINNFFPIYESRMKTLSQYKEELVRTIKKNKQPIVVILEDVDRSGDGGQKFLETLKCFLEEISDKPILIICPQRDYSFGNVVFEEEDSHWDSVAKLEKSIKIYNDVLYGSLSGKVTEEQVSQLMVAAECNDDKLVRTIELTVSACSDLSLLTMRSLKFLLRNVISFIEINKSADPSVVFFFLSRRFLEDKNGVGSNSLTDSIIGPGVSFTVGNNDLIIDLVCHIFEIDLNLYKDVSRLKFEYVDGVMEEDYKVRRYKKNERWLTCGINKKYKYLAVSALTVA